MARRSEHSLEEIKELILAATEEIVEEEGFEALKVRKIAMNIGYTVGSIYMVFDNMEDLILHVKARTLDALNEYLDEVIKINPDPEASIFALCKGYAKFADEHFNFWIMLFSYQSAKPEPLPDWYQEKVNQPFIKFEIFFQKIAPQKNQVEIKNASRTVWAGVHGVCLLALAKKLELVGLEGVEDSIDMLVGNFLAGWKA
ncbi:MAG: TetR/AcrR family transcriptional regulator [Methylococcaceae bacterium]